MPADTLETLRQVNHYLRSALVDLRPDRKPCSTIKPQDFSDILAQLLRAAECLRHPPIGSEDAAAFQKESAEYRANLERLNRLLPDLHIRLLVEKSRLETAQTHAAAAAAWAQARKKSL